MTVFRLVAHWLRGQLDFLGAGLNTEKLDDFVDRLAQAEIQILKCCFSRFDLGHIEYIVDQGQQSPPAGLDNLDVSPLLRSQVCFQQQLIHADDAIHRRTDFVAHVG